MLCETWQKWFLTARCIGGCMKLAKCLWQDALGFVYCRLSTKSSQNFIVTQFVMKSSPVREFGSDCDVWHQVHSCQVHNLTTSQPHNHNIRANHNHVMYCIAWVSLWPINHYYCAIWIKSWTTLPPECSVAVGDVWHLSVIWLLFKSKPLLLVLFLTLKMSPTIFLAHIYQIPSSRYAAWSPPK